MRSLGVVALVAVGAITFSACGGGDAPLAAAGAGGEGAERQNDGEGGSGSDESKGDAGEELSNGSADAGNGSTGADGTCEKGALDCACYGNQTCDDLLRCEDGICVGCDDGEAGCPCYGNGTCNNELTCQSDICVDETGSGQGGAPAGTGGGSSDETGGSAPEATGGNSNAETGGTSPEGTGGSSPEGTGGTSPEGTGGTGGQAQGTGGSTVTDCSNPNVIDDFEDGDTDACPRSSWTTDWWADGDEYGTSYPSMAEIDADKDVLSVTLSPSRATGSLGLRLEGSDFEEWGAMIGVTFNNPTQEMPQPVDLSGYTGVTFYARGSGNLRVAIATVDFQDEAGGGTCVGEWPECYDYFKSGNLALTAGWKQFTVAFSSLSTDEYGYSMSLADKEQILNLLFTVGAAGAEFALWLDDVAFY